jgi:Mn2+/Fe2+ NRAMP family transporter
VTPEDKQSVLDEEHLRLLAMFHYVSGALTCVGSLFAALSAVFVATMSTAFAVEGQKGLSEEALRQMQVMPQVMAGVVAIMAVAGLVFGVLEIVAGRCLSQHRARVFTILVAVPRMLFIPWGTILSVVTVLVLERASVETLYRRRAAGNIGGQAPV